RAVGSTSAKAVVLCARSSGPVGHAFIIFGREDEKKKMSIIEAFGFYPQEGTKPLFGTVPGELANEMMKEGTKDDVRLILKVDDAQFDAVEKVRAEWAKKDLDYKLLKQNCISFTAAAAKALNLKVEENPQAQLPVAFMKKLIQANKN
ncbi:MAG: hypothetical protein ACRCZF_12550, partial [Gemmataceae bacterium]